MRVGLLSDTHDRVPAVEALLARFAEASVQMLVHDLAEANQRSLESHRVIVHGCAHRADMSERGETLLVNPGEACGWLHGTPSGAILDLAARRVEIITLDPAEWRR